MNTVMPVLFVGHGSPMNAVEKNEFTSTWEELGRILPRPRAILAVSAHWFTRGTRTTDAEAPRMVYDMYGFPDELYRVTYPAPGQPELAKRVAGLLPAPVAVDNGWGLDHGAWSVLCRMYPEADIPVVPLSVNAEAAMDEHFRLGRALRPLREEGVLILGSGNVVHDLGRIRWDMDGGMAWAAAFDEYILRAVTEGRFDDAVHYERAGEPAKLAFRTPDHYAPLLYVLGAADENDRARSFNHACVMGSLSMTGFLLGRELPGAAEPRPI